MLGRKSGARRGRSTSALLCLAGILAALAPAWGERVDPALHWPAPPAEVERLLAEVPFRIVSVRGDVGGVMGVRKVGLVFEPSGREMAAKWKAAPAGDADGWNNTPRKELAAYQVQKWFLDPADYVVPTTAVRCIDFATYKPLSKRPKANLPGTRCVAGALVVWMDAVTVPDVLYDEERFRKEPLYARHMANFNLLTYLIDHEDGREGNFLVSEVESERRIFSIDNGVAFGAKVKNFFVPNWNRIRVPALSSESVERLRRIGPAELEALGVLVEMRADEQGILRPVPHTANTNPKRGARVADGWLQLGLRRKEIEKLQERLEALLEEVDSGGLATF